MSEIPADLKYTTSHEWIRENDDGTVTIGITDHAQSALGDLVFVELPEIGTAFAAQENCAVVESVKAASDIYCPLAGEITDVNASLEDEPELINTSPFDAGWIMTLQPNDARDLEDLISADEYLEALE